MIQIETKGFDKTQWEIYYSIKNTEFNFYKAKDQAKINYPVCMPNSVRSDIIRHGNKMKRLQITLAEYSSVLAATKVRR